MASVSLMSHTWHSRTTLAAALLAAGALLSGCSGSGDSSSAAPPPTQDQSSSPVSSPTTASSSPTTQSTPPPSAVLHFSPKSGGKHLEDCQRLEPGDDPAEFLYYPVVITAPVAVTLSTVATAHTQGVVDAGAWVAPTGPTPETGTFKGWPPPSIVTGDPNLQWKNRVHAVGATLDAGVSYNVFLRLQVDPTPGDSVVKGIQLSYTDDPAGDGHSSLWLARTTFSMSC
jgi:hypothetical protein